MIQKCSFSSNSILIVDDNVDLCAAYASYLNDSGYEVSQANSHADALRLITSQEYSVVIVDLKLPGGCGIRLTETALQHFPKKATEFIWISARGSVAEISRGMRIGVCEFLQKPFGCDDLKSAVERAFSLHRSNLTKGDGTQKALEALRAIRAASDDLASTLANHADSHAVDLLEDDPSKLLHELSGEADRFLVANEFARSLTNLNGWLLLLAISKFEAAGQMASVKAISLMACMPMSTTLRKIDLLAEVGLLSIVPDLSDGRRSFVQLSAKSREMLRRYLEIVRRSA